jgi:hypothetical protein
MTKHKTPSEPTDSPIRAPDQRGGKGKQVRRTTPPSESVVASWYKNASLLDSYSIDLTLTVGNPPAWQKDRGARRHGYALWPQNLRYGQGVPKQQ